VGGEIDDQTCGKSGSPAGTAAIPQPEIVKSSGRGEHGADFIVTDTGWVDHERTTGHPAKGVRRAQRRPGAEQIQEAYNFSASVVAAVIITHR
jgi:hypothetical protein